MSEEQRAITLMDSSDGVLILGPEEKFAALDQQGGLKARRLSSRTLSRAGDALGAVASLQSSSGRWVKLDSESATLLKKLGVVNPQSGVVRGESGQILKHLKFENAALLTPAAPAALSAIATQAALEVALEDIHTYLVSIDAKLDRLLKQRKDEVLGKLGGLSASIDEAHTQFARTGKVSAVTWSKVQNTSGALNALQSEALAHLDTLAESVADQEGNIQGSARVLTEAQDEAIFWLGVLAKSLFLQDRQYGIELARVADDDAESLQAHHEGIKIARTARARKIRRQLQATRSSISQCAELSNLSRVMNPAGVKKIIQGANIVNDTITHFADYAALDLNEHDALESVAWRTSAKAVIGDVGKRVGAVGGQMADTATGLRDSMQARREKTLRAKLEKLQSRRIERPTEKEVEQPDEILPSDQE